MKKSVNIQGSTLLKIHEFFLVVLMAAAAGTAVIYSTKATR